MEVATSWWDPAGSELLKILFSLLPGLVTVAIIQSLTVREKQEPLERVIQALLYSFVNYATWELLSLPFYGFNPEKRPAIAHFLGLSLCALGWGILMTSIINTGWLHDLLRDRLGLTKRLSRPNEWYDAFYRHDRYVVLHLQDGRRLFGWPRVYSEQPDRGHILLEDAEWLDSPDDRTVKTALLVSTSDVKFVEFVPFKEN